MDSINLDQWRDVIEQVLLDYAAIPYSYSEVRKEAVFDRERDRYLVLAMGWEGYRYEHGCMVQSILLRARFGFSGMGRRMELRWIWRMLGC